MKLVADDKIPHISDFFTECDDIVLLPFDKISRADLKNADILLTRTVTKIDADFLKDTSIQFVGSVTTGTDHVDTEWLSTNHISFADAAGANSTAVAEYVLCCIAGLKKQQHLQKLNPIAGIIGFGRIGRIVAKHLQALGFEVICYDPLITEKLNFNFTTLPELIDSADFITIHTPLTTTGLYPTYHMINDPLLKRIKPNTILLNTARGSVIDQSALLHTKNIILCLDVWENEPAISRELLDKVIIGTPHIAGYSTAAKYRATEMVYESAARFFGWKQSPVKNNSENNKQTHNFIFTENWIENTLAIYDPLAHTTLFRNAFKNAATEIEMAAIFTEERKKYPFRKELYPNDLKMRIKS